LTRLLNWGADLVRPYIVVSDGTLSARFNLGVYNLSSPVRSLAETPTTYEVQGYDMLLRLSQPVGNAYSIAAGDAYLTRVAEILANLGYTSVIIDQTSIGTLAPSTRTWAFDDSITWLRIVNDLLGSIGYQGIWADWNGRLRCEPYINPISRAPEWYYSDDAATTMLSADRSITHDNFNAYNKWVFYRSNGTDDVAPTEGAGMYTYVNQSLGATSVDARNGMLVTKVLGIDAADQSSLIASGNITINADMTSPTTVNVKTFVNPLHWHFDRLFVQDSAGIPVFDAQCTSWELQLPPDEAICSRIGRSSFNEHEPGRHRADRPADPRQPADDFGRRAPCRRGTRPAPARWSSSTAARWACP
jgi:hypothetical protein